MQGEQRRDRVAHPHHLYGRQRTAEKLSRQVEAGEAHHRAAHQKNGEKARPALRRTPDFSCQPIPLVAFEPSAARRKRASCAYDEWATHTRRDERPQPAPFPSHGELTTPPRSRLNYFVGQNFRMGGEPTDFSCARAGETGEKRAARMICARVAFCCRVARAVFPSPRADRPCARSTQRGGRNCRRPQGDVRRRLPTLRARRRRRA